MRAPNGRTSSPELSDFLDAASVALYSVPYLRERLVNLQVSFADRGALLGGLMSADDVLLVCWRFFACFLTHAAGTAAPVALGNGVASCHCTF